MKFSCYIIVLVLFIQLNNKKECLINFNITNINVIKLKKNQFFIDFYLKNITKDSLYFEVPYSLSDSFLISMNYYNFKEFKNQEVKSYYNNSKNNYDTLNKLSSKFEGKMNFIIRENISKYVIIKPNDSIKLALNLFHKESNKLKLRFKYIISKEPILTNKDSIKKNILEIEFKKMKFYNFREFKT